MFSSLRRRSQQRPASRASQTGQPLQLDTVLGPDGKELDAGKALGKAKAVALCKLPAHLPKAPAQLLPAFNPLKTNERAAHSQCSDFSAHWVGPGRGVNIEWCG